MNKEEIKKLAIECGAIKTNVSGHSGFAFILDMLPAYTAAVEAKERERCINACESVLAFNYDSPEETFIKAIRELK